MILIKARITEDRPVGISRDAWRKMSRAVHKAAAVHWQQHMLPLHFREDAAQKYRYKFRTKKYRDEKEAKARMGRPYRKGQGPILMGGRVANVLTGHMRDMLSDSGIIKAYPTRATLVMQGPRYITMRVYKSNQPDKAGEVTTVLQSEKKELARVMDEELQKQLDGYKKPTVTNP